MDQVHFYSRLSFISLYIINSLMEEAFFSHIFCLVGVGGMDKGSEMDHDNHNIEGPLIVSSF